MGLAVDTGRELLAVGRWGCRCEDCRTGGRFPCCGPERTTVAARCRGLTFRARPADAPLAGEARRGVSSVRGNDGEGTAGAGEHGRGTGARESSGSRPRWPAARAAATAATTPTDRMAARRWRDGGELGLAGRGRRAAVVVRSAGARTTRRCPAPGPIGRPAVGAADRAGPGRRGEPPELPLLYGGRGLRGTA